MRGARAGSIAANPVLIGAVTVLVAITAVFLAYNANDGLPFVPVFQMKVETPNAARLVVGNEVREGGFRIGAVSQIETVRDEAGEPMAAVLTLNLDESAAPIPVDSDFSIRPRSVLGLKYVELVRGQAPQALRAGSTVSIDETAIPPDFSDVFTMFDQPTRQNIKTNLATFGGAFAGRGMSLNRTLQELPELLTDLQPVMRSLSDPATELDRFIDELADGARVTRPVSQELASGFTFAADTFEGLSRDPAALQETIAEAPPTLQTGIETLPDTRPFLRELAAISPEISATARSVRASVPSINSALSAGTPVLRRVPAFNEDLETALSAIDDLTSSPTTNLVLDGFNATTATLDPTLKYLGPFFTVCNYWNYFWTHTVDHFRSFAGPEIGFFQRIQAKSAPEQDNTPAAFGAAEPANSEGVVEPTTEILGDPADLKAQFHGRAVDENGQADCDAVGSRYNPALPLDLPPDLANVSLATRNPGNQGTTFEGRGEVPRGQTFTAEPGGLGPDVARGPGVGR